MVSCLFSKVQEFFHMLTAHLPSLFSEAVHVFQKVSFTLAMSSNHMFFFFSRQGGHESFSMFLQIK